METPEFAEAQRSSSDSANTTAVPEINFKRYLGATVVRYINMGQASEIQDNPKWDLEESRGVRQVEQKFAIDLKTITGETTNDEKFFETLVCLETQSPKQMLD